MKDYSKNPRQITDKQHGDLKTWLAELGDLSGIVHDLNTDEVISGNMRSHVFVPDKCDIVFFEQLDEPDDQGTVAHSYIIWQGKKNSYRQVRWTAEQCEKANIIANKAGGSFDFDKLANEFDINDLMEWGFTEFDLGIAEFDEIEELPEKLPNPRILAIDVIYTIQGADATCCLAVRAGLKYGIQSSSYVLCPYCVRGDEAHKVAFIDNDYFNYEHEVHLKAIKELRPKYATVCDIMTKAQCEEASVKHYPLNQILEWAEELQQYAENVIVIPKYDCLDKIPNEYILGYSIPSSHGSTPLPFDLFRGRRVHLLGGSWKKQLHYLAFLGEDIISLDNNYVAKLATEFGSFITLDGESRNLSGDLYPMVNNIRYTALALSFGAMGAKVNELYASAENLA